MKNLKKHIGKIFLIISIILLGLAWQYSQTQAEINNQGITQTENIKGNPNAEITLVKFGDFECPFCAQAAPQVDEILEKYDGQIRFEYKHLPLSSIHPRAVPASQAAEAAGQQGKFFEYHDLLYTNQREWSRSTNPYPIFDKYAQELELDLEKFNRHQKSSILLEKIVNDRNFATQNGYNSTPTFLINGEQISYTGQEALEARIEELLN